MTASVDQVQANVGRTLSVPERAQVELWLGWASQTIARRMGDLTALDQPTLEMVLVEAVSRRLRNPEGVTQETVTVDDATVSRTRGTAASGLIDILPEWWEALGWQVGGAFSVRPYGAPDTSPDAWR